MSEGKIHNVVNRLIDGLRKEDMTKDLEGDEQCKMRAVNTDPDNKKLLNEYIAESRILTTKSLYNEFLYKSLQVANKNQKVFNHKIFDPEITGKQIPQTNQPKNIKKFDNYEKVTTNETKIESPIPVDKPISNIIFKRQ